MVDALTLLVVFAVCGAGLYVAARIEPHWASKDGRRFIARVQQLHADGVHSRWREVRAMVNGDGSLMVQTRSRLGGRLAGVWTVAGRSDDPPPRRAVYLLDGHIHLALRLPSNSRAVPVLDSLLDGTFET